MNAALGSKRLVSMTTRFSRVSTTLIWAQISATNRSVLPQKCKSNNGQPGVVSQMSPDDHRLLTTTHCNCCCCCALAVCTGCKMLEKYWCLPLPLPATCLLRLYICRCLVRQYSVPSSSECRYVPDASTSTVARTGTTPHTATARCSSLCQTIPHAL